MSLDRLGFQTQGMAWQTAPGAQAQIGYGGGSVSVKDLRLVSDNQEIVVGGTFGQPEDTMQVTAQNVNLAAIDALLLRPPIAVRNAQRLRRNRGHERRAEGGGQVRRASRARSARRASTRSAARSITNGAGSPSTPVSSSRRRTGSTRRATSRSRLSRGRGARCASRGPCLEGGCVRPAHPQHADRSRAGAGDDDRAHQRPTARRRRPSTSPAPPTIRIRAA